MGLLGRLGASRASWGYAYGLRSSQGQGFFGLLGFRGGDFRVWGFSGCGFRV